MQLKGKLIKWNADKAFGFILPNDGGDTVFIHKKALTNQSRSPKINDVITFLMIKDTQGRYCADQATFAGEKRHKKKAKPINKFSIYLSVLFLTSLAVTYFFGCLPQKLVFTYLIVSIITFVAYALDKSKAKRGAWRTPESTLHLFALFGGWPGAALAQQMLRHKSAKTKFRIVFWLTVVVNSTVLGWLMTTKGSSLLMLLT